MAVSVALTPDKASYAKGAPVVLTWTVTGADPDTVTFNGTLKVDGVDYPATGSFQRTHVVGPGTVPGYTVDAANPLVFRGVA